MHDGFLHSTLFRMLVAAAAGAGSAAAIAAQTQPLFGVIAGWVVAAAVFCVWTWIAVGRLDPDQARSHALREDPGRAVGDIALLVASVGAIVGVGVLIWVSASHQGSSDVAAALGIAAVAASWCMVHTLFMLRYARQYFAIKPGGVDFNSDDDPDDDAPDYGDFAYLAFTIGMTYQVSDTTFTNKTMRRTALHHALISFGLGAIVLAATINLVSQLASSG